MSVYPADGSARLLKHFCNLVGFEVLTAVTMKDAVFWDMKPQFAPHRKHIKSPLQSPAG
jgi:hypothetical protein